MTQVTSEKAWWARFFAKFAETGNVTIASEAAGVTRKTVYQYRNDCPEFAERWKEAEALGLARLEDVATERALATSDTMLIFLLKTRLREKYGEVVRNEHAGSIAIAHDDEAILAAADAIRANRERLRDAAE